MKSVTFDVKFKVTLLMPDAYDPREVMSEVDYDFFPEDDVSVLDTDMYEYAVTTMEAESIDEEYND
jgi:hypothetical protein